MNSFADFTNLYSLSKTLKFELKPVGNTTQMLEDNKVFEVDENRHKAYEEIKPYFDKLHREFVHDALTDAKLSGLEGYLVEYKKYKVSKDKKQIEAPRKNLRKQITTFYIETARTWLQNYPNVNLKKKDHSFLFEADIFSLLKSRYGDDEKTFIIDKATGERVSIFDRWQGFSGYFDKFFQTRRNFYEVEGKASAIATRIIDQNLSRFIDNILTFESTLRNSGIDLTLIEKQFDIKLNEFLNVNFYNKCLLQNGIDRYNKILGGKTLDNGEKLRGINELINEYRQVNKDAKLPFLKKLDNQILGEKESGFFVLTEESDAIQLLGEFHQNTVNKLTLLDQTMGRFFANIDNADLDKIYFSKEAINTISRMWIGETKLFQDSLYQSLKSAKLIKGKGKGADEEYKFPDFIPFTHIKNAVESIENELLWKESYIAKNPDATSIEYTPWVNFVQILNHEFTQNFKKFNSAKDNLAEVLLQNNLTLQPHKDTIKEFADSALSTYQLAKYFALEKSRVWDDNYEIGDFYTDPEVGYFAEYYPQAYEQIVKPYNDLRNYLTKKPYSEQKWKLNFENTTLAAGWDKNKEKDNSAVLFLKDGKHYLGIMKLSSRNLFLSQRKADFSVKTNEDSYTKLVYKLLPGPNKMLPKVFFSKKSIEYYSPSSEILRIRNHSSHTKNGDAQKGYEKHDFNLNDCHAMIDFFKESITKHPEWKDFGFKFSPTNSYKTIDEFYREVDANGYHITYESISESYIDQQNKVGNLYLFEISNKDSAAGSWGTKNLHSLYFSTLFSAENKARNFVFKLNGEAEVFYRPKTRDLKKEKIITGKGVELSKGKKAYQKNRYTENKVFFHVPITLNRLPKDVKRFNNYTNEFLATSKDINIIGIDRGEKHLAYYSIIDQNGKLIKSESLNVVNGIDYHTKLTAVAGDREQARKNWDEVAKIKDLKKGYISHVVRKLADLAIKHNAIIVMEDLNMRFKQIRGGIEKSIYQQLEKALIDKLSFLVNKKEMDPEKAGHLLKAYQLSAPFESFQAMGKQTGIIFYTQAAYTSKIDPLTGWRPNLYLKYSNAQKAKDDILKFKNITFGGNKFSFTYDIKDFVDSKDYPSKTEWTVCSNVERFRWDRKLNSGKGGHVHYKNITENINNLFLEFNIDKNSDIKKQIADQDATQKESVKLFRDLIFYISLICQIRNTQKDKNGSENDFILSPVQPFFDSRHADDFDAGLPKNGDENGAYNIARKGIIILDKISKYKKQHGSVDKMQWKDLSISSKEWDDFAAK